MLATLSVALTAPAAHSTGVTVDHLTITVTVSGQPPATFTIAVPVSSSGVVTIPVGSGVLSQIKSAFGTTSFVFPGSYTGSFTIDGISFTVTLKSTDTFTLTFT
jgi:outer membrane receptor protein involved in Fe transport